MKNCKQTAAKCNQSFENGKKLPPLKHILALPIWGQICTNLETELFEITNFDLGHPVILKWTTSLYAFKKSKVAW